MQTFFVDVIVPLPLMEYYTYRVPFDLNDEVAVGKRVLVQFGSKKILTGLIAAISEVPPREYEAKYLMAIIDGYPCANALQLKFWQWISSYYMCSMGEVMNAALPSGMKLNSETNIVYNKEAEVNFETLSPGELLLIEALEHNEKLSYKEASTILENKGVNSTIQHLLKKEYALLEEEVIQNYKPKLVNQVALNKEYQNEFAIESLFNTLGRAPKQSELLLSYLSVIKKEQSHYGFVDKSKLTALVPASSGAMKSLVEKGIFTQILERQSRVKEYEGNVSDAFELNEYQQAAYAEINTQFESQDVILLHGITSSGKTEIYIKLIQEVIAKGQQVLYLLPEIALTSQIINRLRRIFGKQVGVYHSKFSDNERVEIYESLSNPNSGMNKPMVILGARSSIFLPYENLGLIIVDEEHETSYKQFDPSPRYHARDASVVLGRIHQAKVLMGTATPAIETYHNAKFGKYGLVELKNRYKDIQLPEIQLADLKEAYKNKQMMSHFTPKLVAAIGAALEKKEQVMLFQNRRGFAPHLECATCGWVPMCKYCNVTLTYHKKVNSLKCHYCGHIAPVTNICPACNSNDIRFTGFGTEKIEEEIGIFFPEARIGRMDYDTTRAKDAYERILDDFENRKIDILVGTQMITKGLDFENVSLVGILNADNMLFFPDFRAFERSFQLMTQVSGRAGRKNGRGLVIAQTFAPEHQILQYVIDNNYTELFNTEAVERMKYHYPPFSRLIKITIRHKEEHILDKAAGEMGKLLRKKYNEQVLGPEYPVISRIKNYYIKEIMMKIEQFSQLPTIKKDILNCASIVKQMKDFKQAFISFNVDPL